MAHPLLIHLNATSLTQAQFAQQLGVRPATVTGWLQGVTPRPSNMREIEALTGGAVPVSVWFAEVAGKAEAAT